MSCFTIIALPVVFPEEELVRISLDELGIYFVVKQSNNNTGRDTYGVLYQRHDSNTTFILGGRMNFSDAVSVVLSTSPGMQPYPAGVAKHHKHLIISFDCFKAHSFSALRQLFMNFLFVCLINKFVHQIAKFQCKLQSLWLLFFGPLFDECSEIFLSL